MKHLCSERGAQLLEFALVLPVLLLIVAGTAEFGLLFRTAEITGNAAREGARLAVIPGNEADGYGTVRARVQGFLSDSGLTDQACTPDLLTCADTTVESVPVVLPSGLTALGVRVTVRYRYRCLFLRPIATLVNGTFANSITYRSTALMRVQAPAVGS